MGVGDVAEGGGFGEGDEEVDEVAWQEDHARVAVPAEEG